MEVPFEDLWAASLEEEARAPLTRVINAFNVFSTDDGATHGIVLSKPEMAKSSLKRHVEAAWSKLSNNNESSTSDNSSVDDSRRTCGSTTMEAWNNCLNEAMLLPSLVDTVAKARIQSQTSEASTEAKASTNDGLDTMYSLCPVYDGKDLWTADTSRRTNLENVGAVKELISEWKSTLTDEQNHIIMTSSSVKDLCQTLETLIYQVVILAWISEYEHDSDIEHLQLCDPNIDEYIDMPISQAAGASDVDHNSEQSQLQKFVHESEDLQREYEMSRDDDADH
jgi:hypothetical protein